ncbi:hypothetical protein GCM10029992_54090 [Glycomyces albus]
MAGHDHRHRRGRVRARRQADGRAQPQAEIVADAALAVLAKDPKAYTGNAVLVEDVLAAEGVTDLSGYAVVSGQTDFQPDIYVD